MQRSATAAAPAAAATAREPAARRPARARRRRRHRRRHAAHGRAEQGDLEAVAADEPVGGRVGLGDVQLELAQAAQGAGDFGTAAAAYEAFLRLAPDDPTAPEVKRILEQLRQQIAPSG